MVPKQPVARNNVSHYRLVMSCDLYVRVECDSGRRVWCVGGVLPCVGCQSACAVHRPNGTRARNAPFDCVRVRSLPGPAHFASLRSAAGAVGRAVGTGARALPRGGHSAPACPSSVGSAPHPPMSGIRLGRNTSRRRLPPLCGDACIPPPVRAPAPFPPHVRWRATGTCPFLRCASRAPYKEQGERVGSQLRTEASEMPPIRRREVFRPSRATADRAACGRGAPSESAGAGGAPTRRPHFGSALTECAGREMPPPLAEPARGSGMHGDGLAPDGNLAIAERGEDAARRSPPRAGEVAAAFPAP